MGNIGNKLPLVVIGFLNFLRHKIQSIRKVGHFIPSADGNPIQIFSCGIVYRSCRNFPQGLINPKIKNEKNGKRQDCYSQKASIENAEQHGFFLLYSRYGFMQNQVGQILVISLNRSLGQDMFLGQQTVEIAPESNFTAIFRRIKIAHSLSAQIVLPLML